MNGKEGIKLTIAEDQPTLRSTLESSLKDSFEICAVVSNGKELVEAQRNTPANVIISDIRMPEMDGLTAVKEIRKNDKDVKILMLTLYCEKTLVNIASETGVNAYLSKDSELRTIISTIQYILVNNVFVVGDDVIEKHKRIYEVLSPRETEILDMRRIGYALDQIAEKLFIQKTTADTHWKNILSKTNKTTVELLGIEEEIIL